MTTRTSTFVLAKTPAPRGGAGKKGLAVETLESRLNLSAAPFGAEFSAPGLAKKDIFQTQIQDKITAARPQKLDAFIDADVTSGPQLLAGGKRSRGSATTTGTGSSNTGTTVITGTVSTTTGTTTTTPSTNTADPSTTPAPAAPAFTTSPVSVTTKQMNGYTELVITGTSGNDSILVTESGSTFTITANGSTQTVTGAYGDIVVHGGAGDDVITVDSSVVLRTYLYGDAGNDQVYAKGAGRMTVVTVGGGSDYVVSNGTNTSVWADQSGTDVVIASSAEVSAGMVHRVTTFYQPWTTDTGSPDYITKELAGQNLKDPTDSGGVSRNASASLWGLGPTMDDATQGNLADCYFISPMASLAQQQPAALQERAVDLGDGTYAVAFTRGGKTDFVRVDGDLPGGGWTYAHAKSSGNLWASVVEKAYAFYRSGANTYNSLAWGYHNQTFNDLGFSVGSTAATNSSLFSIVSNALSAGKPVTAQSTSGASGAIVASHVYSVVSAFKDASGAAYFTVRNPWGYDGGSPTDANGGDGLITLSNSQFASLFYNVVYGV